MQQETHVIILRTPGQPVAYWSAAAQDWTTDWSAATHYPSRADACAEWHRAIMPPAARVTSCAQR